MGKRSRNRNRVRKKIEINPKYLLGTLFVICLALIFTSYRYADRFAPAMVFVNNTITPMQKGIRTVGDRISDRFSIFSDIEKLIADNQRLQEEVDEHAP